MDIGVLFAIAFFVMLIGTIVALLGYTRQTKLVEHDPQGPAPGSPTLPPRPERGPHILQLEGIFRSHEKGPIRFADVYERGIELTLNDGSFRWIDVSTIVDIDRLESWPGGATRVRTGFGDFLLHAPIDDHAKVLSWWREQGEYRG